LSAQLPYKALADSVGLQTQGPWVYSQRLDEDKQVQFLATTRARDTEEVYLFISCGSSRPALSLIALGGYTYSVRERGQISVAFDQSERIRLAVVRIDSKSLMTDPRALRDLLPVLRRSHEMSAWVTGIDGAVHPYVFELQPNDVALAHCP
jgi:hypothetical protein